MKKVISTSNAPAAIGPYSQAIQVGNMLFMSGQLGIDPSTAAFVEGGITEQTIQSFKNMNAILTEAGFTMNDVVKTTVFLADMNDFATERRFDRVVSVEMFEHMRNYQQFMARINTWLKPGGKLFVHIFTHRQLAYPFETEGDDNWMGRYFFTGGLMPSRDLLPRFQDDLKLEEQWNLNGRHYQRTLEAWLIHQDQHRKELLELFTKTYGLQEAKRWFQRWRVFFMACAELFGYRGGEEWGVSHYRFGRRN